MKEKLGIPQKYINRPLADFLDPIAITAKKLATQISNYNVKQKDLQGEEIITKEHQQSNLTIRNALLERGVVPENLPPSEDIKKVEKRLKDDVKTISNKKSNKNYDR